MAFVLIVQGRQYPITPKGITIGRGPENAIVLADERASRLHARVWLQGTQVYVQDMGSTNGTFVNDSRISGPHPLRVGDRVKIGQTTLQLAMTPGPVSAPSSVPLWPVLAIIGVVVLVGVLLLAVVRPSGTGIPPTPVDPIERGRLATVMISVCLSVEGKEHCLPVGSGSVVDPRGYILTNYHVVDIGDSLEALEALGLGLQASFLISVNSERTDEPVRPAYRAEILETDKRLDLAILHITARSDGGPLRGQLNMVTVPLGDSDQLNYGDEIRILGYPATGVLLEEEELDLETLEAVLESLEKQLARMTVTLTRGTVSGFLADNLGHQRGWIKTDAEITEGNSGGLAMNAAGELIGVPTLVTVQEDLGRLGYLRPINLARPLLSRIP